jgi:UDP-N-acetylglucosamine--N-acetylmuramyl-(pentapeptide) pyrophosphoryl-undecaprenol N-acetylglucosamine transferase
MKVIISGGGTGGHIYPAIAIADGLKAVDPTIDILFVGALGKMEMEKVPKAGYPIKGLKIRGFDRAMSVRNIKLPFNLLSSLMKARGIIKRFRPDVAVGVGGYASGPLLYAAGRSNIPTLIQEQNSFPGITNKLLSRKARTICVAYEGLERYFKNKPTVLTGNPVRNDIADLEAKKEEAYAYFGLEKGKPVIFAFGGSLGARTINKSIAEQTDLLRDAEVQVIWQTGSYYHGALVSSEAALLSNVHPLAFVDRMDLAYAAADVIIGRAGALTISELCLVGKPAILVPSPNVAEDHQTKNAQALVDKSAALLVKDSDAKETLLLTALELLKEEERKAELGRNIKQLAKPNATQAIVEEILKLKR